MKEQYLEKQYLEMCKKLNKDFKIGELVYFVLQSYPNHYSIDYGKIIHLSNTFDQRFGISNGANNYYCIPAKLIFKDYEYEESALCAYCLRTNTLTSSAMQEKTKNSEYIIKKGIKYLDLQKKCGQ